MADPCKHEKVTIYFRQLHPATRYDPAEYEEWAECDECGKKGDPADFAGAEITDECKVIDKTFHGYPHEFFD